jgi:hypothetical protein
MNFHASALRSPAIISRTMGIQMPSSNTSRAPAPMPYPPTSVWWMVEPKKAMTRPLRNTGYSTVTSSSCPAVL